MAITVGDQEVLDALRQSGSDLSRPHALELYLYLPDEARARRAAFDLSAEGVAVITRRASMGPGWLCLARMSMVPAPDAIAEIRNRFEGLAAELGGEFDGWEAGVVKR